MARTLNMALLAAAIAVAALVQSSRAQTSHTVGGSLGWLVPSNGNTTYAVWAASQSFTVGDTLVFNFATGSHNVAEVTKANYDACNTSNPILVKNTGPANITLNATGEHYFICAYTGHCAAGQKLAINVSAAVTASPSPAPQTTPPSAPSPALVPSSTPTPTPSSSPSPSPSSSPVTYIVGDISKNWTVPAPDTTYYQTWAANKSFKVGDILVFNYANGSHDVAEVTKEGYESCNATTATQKALYTTPPTTITLNTSGEHFFICTFTQHCPLGQKLAINVTGTTTTSPSPSPSGSPTTAPSPSPSGSPTTAPSPSPSGTPSTAPSPSPSGSPPAPPTTSQPPASPPSTPPASPPPPSASPPSGGSSSPPPPSGSTASSLGVAGVSATLLSILVALFLC